MKRPAMTLAASTLGLGLVLSGCNGMSTGTEAVDDTTGDPNQPAATTDAPDARPTPSPADDATGDTTQGITNIDVVESAITTAEGEGGTVVSIDSEASGTWEVVAIEGDIEYEHTISSDGSTIENTEQDDADADDQEIIGATSVPLIEAIRAVGESQQGELDDAELNEDGGTIRYEVSLQGEQMDYHVDPSTREVTQDQ